MLRRKVRKASKKNGRSKAVAAIVLAAAAAFLARIASKAKRRNADAPSDES